MNYYSEYIIMKAELKDAQNKIAGAKFELLIADKENLKMRAKTEHLPEYVNQEIERLKKMVKACSHQERKLKEQIESIKKKHRKEREYFITYYQEKIDNLESNRLHFERIADVNRIAVLEFENKHLQAELNKLTDRLEAAIL